MLRAKSREKLARLQGNSRDANGSDAGTHKVAVPPAGCDADVAQGPSGRVWKTACRSRRRSTADIDLLPVGELGLHRLGQDGGGVAASLAALIDAALICDGGAGDVAIPAGDGA